MMMSDKFHRQIQEQDQNDSVHLTRIYDELTAARVKHPRLADKLADSHMGVRAQASLPDYRRLNSMPCQYYSCILMEEYYEAMEAYFKGDQASCLKELAQVGAVVMRMMDYVEMCANAKLISGEKPEEGAK